MLKVGVSDLINVVVTEIDDLLDLYLLAFDKRLRREFSGRELMALSDTMAERGLRLRRALADVLEEAGEGIMDAKDVVDGGEEDDELEIESRERRRLMPY